MQSPRSPNSCKSQRSPNRCESTDVANLPLGSLAGIFSSKHLGSRPVQKRRGDNVLHVFSNVRQKRMAWCRKMMNKNCVEQKARYLTLGGDMFWRRIVVKNYLQKFQKIHKYPLKTSKHNLNSSFLYSIQLLGCSSLAVSFSLPKSSSTNMKQKT